METWKDVEGYDGLYQVSDLGRVRSLGRTSNSKNGSTQKKRKRILVQEITIHGYCRVRLYDKDGNSKHYAVHRLVLETFRGKSELQINHINEIKTDNRVTNLEYCTAKENCNHGTRSEKISEAPLGKSAKKVVQLDKNNNVIAVYSSRVEAQEKTGILASSIGRVCNGNRKTTGGYYWRDV